jgi:hypothetical protein
MNTYLRTQIEISHRFEELSLMHSSTTSHYEEMRVGTGINLVTDSIGLTNCTMDG